MRRSGGKGNGVRDAPRIHVEDALEADALLRPDEERAHYLRHVMRLGPGDAVRVFNARGGEWSARIAEAGKRGVVLRCETRRRPPARPAATPILLFAPLKRDATDTVVRMATELGAASIRPVMTARTVAGRVNVERLRLIAREAAEQCERLDVPEVAEPAGLDAVLAGWDAGLRLAVAAERRAAPPLGCDGARADAVLVGPEGGFAPAELDQILRAPFVQPVSLGALVLRADTAAAAALALLRAGHGWQEGPGEVDVEPG